MKYVRPLFAAVLLLTVVTSVSTAPGRAAVSGSSVEIAVVLPLTGFGAVVGKPEKDGFAALEQYVNASGGIQNHPLHFTFYDDQSVPQVSVQLFNQIAARGTQVVFGGAFSANCKASAPLAEQKGPLLYCLSPAVVPTRDSFVFSSYYYLVDLCEKALAYFHKRGWNRVAFLLSTDATGQELENHLEELLARPSVKGVEAVAREHFDPNAVSVAAQIAKIRTTNPQAIVIWTAAGTATTFHALADAGVDLPVASAPAFSYAAMAQFAGFLPKELYFAMGRWAQYPDISPGPIKDQLVKYFAALKAAGVISDGGEALVWDPGRIVVEALRKYGPDAKAAQIKAYIEQLHGFAGINGVYDFRTGDQRGLNISESVMTVWSPQKNTWVLVP